MPQINEIDFWFLTWCNYGWHHLISRHTCILVGIKTPPSGVREYPPDFLNYLPSRSLAHRGTETPHPSGEWPLTPTDNGPHAVSQCALRHDLPYGMHYSFLPICFQIDRTHVVQDFVLKGWHQPVQKAAGLFVWTMFIIELVVSSTSKGLLRLFYKTMLYTDNTVQLIIFLNWFFSIIIFFKKITKRNCLKTSYSAHRQEHLYPWFCK